MVGVRPKARLHIEFRETGSNKSPEICKMS